MVSEIEYEEMDERYRPARDWYTHDEVMNGATAFTPTYEHVFDFCPYRP